MRLHNVAFRLTNIALWLSITGRNGRYWGTHLWEIEEGAPPTEPETRAAWQSVIYWSPRRFGWRPFEFRYFMRNGFVRPLCGARSNSASPRVGAGRPGNCERCEQIARQRGIVPLTYTEATQTSTAHAALMEEQREWLAAGRPSPWPPAPSS